MRPAKAPMASWLYRLSSGAASAGTLRGAQEVSDVLSCQGS
jgi:hypothetical protein